MLAIEYPEDSQEEVDNVEVQRDRGGNLLLDVIMAHNELCINQDVPTEDQRSDRAIDHLSSAVVLEECSYEAEEDKYP